MKTILLPFHDENAGRTALEAATLVAKDSGVNSKAYWYRKRRSSASAAA